MGAAKRRGKAPARTPETIEDELRTLAADISDTDARLRDLWTRRTQLYREGTDLGMSKASIGRAAGVTKEAVIHALKRDT